MKNEVWLIRWQSRTSREGDPEGIALVLPGHYSEQYVQLVVETLYLCKTSTPAEMLGYATGSPNPYPAEVHPLVKGGNAIVCGHSPFLEAIRVKSASSVEALLREAQ